MRKLRKFKRRIFWNNVLTLLLLIGIILIIRYVKSYHYITIDDYSTETFTVPVHTKEPPDVESVYTLLPKRRRFDQVVTKTRLLWSNDYVYYVEFSAVLTNHSGKRAVGVVQQYVHTIREGILYGQEHKVNIKPNQSIKIYDKIYLPHGKHSKMKSGQYFGVLT